MKNKISVMALILSLFLCLPLLAQEKVSLDFKGMDIVDVLKILATRGNMNIVIGKNVTGRVTLFLKEVDINDAFEIIILSNDLAYDKQGDIINVMTGRDYELIYGEKFDDKKQLLTIPLKYSKATTLAQALAQVKSNIGRVISDESTNTLILIDLPQKLTQMKEMVQGLDRPLETRVFSLNYAAADKLQPKLQEVITKGIGSIKMDERTNKIVVTDYSEKLNEISQIVNAFDEKTPQVLIDAQIIEIKPSDTFKMGVDWEYWLKKNVRLLESLPTASGTNILKIGMAAKGAASLGEQGEYKGVIDLLRTIGDTKILSSPRIAVVNNQEAKILIGTKQVYVSQTTSQSGTGTEVTADQVNFVDVGIKLYVTPTINREGFITMKIKPEVSSVKENYTYGSPAKTIPIVETSETETTVMIKDGVTIIIGGLKKDKREKTVNKIPIVGDIPLIGFLFRRTSDSTERTELVILLTPHILSGADSYVDFSQPKPMEGTRAKMEKGKIITEKFSSSRQEEALKLLSPDTYEPTIDEYCRMITDKINQCARRSAPPGLRGEVKVNFALASDGVLIAEPVASGATSPELVPYALKAVEEAAPFSPFPEAIAKNQENFGIVIDYK